MDVAVRRRGIAGLLLNLTMDDPTLPYREWAVRTLEVNHPAIALYQGQGFVLKPAAAETRHGRPRVYLVNHEHGRERR